MTRYYDKRVNKIINTENEISSDMLKKKTFLLPILVINNSYEEGTEPEEEAGLYVEDEQVREVKNSFYHVNTLEEEKQSKITELRDYVSPYFPEIYQQINSVSGEYEEEKATAILTKISNLREYIHTFEDTINGCTTVEEVKEIDYTFDEVEN